MRYSIFVLLLTLLSCTNTATSDKDQKTKDSTASSKEIKMPVDSSITMPDRTPLVITPLNIEGGLGMITFSQKGKTLVHFNLKANKGKININNTEYELDNLEFSATSGTYVLTGNGVTVTAPQVKYKANTGEDCGYGTFDEIAVLLKDNVLKIAKVDLQDCPDY